MLYKLVTIVITAETHDWFYSLLTFLRFCFYFPCNSVCFRGHYGFFTSCFSVDSVAINNFKADQ